MKSLSGGIEFDGNCRCTIQYITFTTLSLQSGIRNMSSSISRLIHSLIIRFRNTKKTHSRFVTSNIKDVLSSKITMTTHFPDIKPCANTMTSLSPPPKMPSFDWVLVHIHGWESVARRRSLETKPFYLLSIWCRSAPNTDTMTAWYHQSLQYNDCLSQVWYHSTTPGPNILPLAPCSIVGSPTSQCPQMLLLVDCLNYN